MAYQHKQILTRVMIERVLSPDPKETRLMATILLVVTLLVAAVATLFIFLIVPMVSNLDEDSPGIYVAVGVVWVIAAAIMIAAGKAVVRSCKPPRIPDFYVTKRRLDTISYNERQPSSGRHSVERDVFYAETMDKYFPTPTQMELAEEGDMYYVVTSVEGGTTPLRIYRADAYIWQE
jgi:hypothetical protein